MYQPALAADPLLEPLHLKKLTLKNRIFSTSHAIRFGVDGLPQDRYQRYHEEKAKGGIGLTMFGGSSNVSPDSGSVFGALNLRDDSVIPVLAQFADRVHRHGTAIMCQLTHLGGRSHWRAENWLPTVAPSRFREPLHRGFAKEIEPHDIRRITQEFGEAARRCKEAGLDGVELHVHHHLVGQFWSPHMNKRTDAYGGSVENRARFGLEALEEMRRLCGPDFIIGIRMAVGEGDGGGMSDADYLEMAHLHEASGLIDFFNLTYGRIDTAVGLSEYMPGMAVKLAPQLPFVAEFRKQVGLPTFHAARINDLATARYAISEGLVDLIGMTRAHIADPHIVEKLSEGREAEIRPCVGATYCSAHGSCIHNPSIGREKVLPHAIEPAPVKRRVTIVGAGVGGLEAARVATERGHAVTVFEAAPQAGGQLLLAAQLHKRRDLIGIVDWRLNELERLGVAITYNCLAGEEEIAASNPDVVIIATGGLPDRMEDMIPGAELADTLWEVLESGQAPEGEVLVYDGTGTIAGLHGATTLALRGAKVSFVTPDRNAGEEATNIERPLSMRQFYQAGVSLLPDMQLVSVARADNRIAATFANIYTGNTETRVTDRLVIENGTIPMDDTYLALRETSANKGAFDMARLTVGETVVDADAEGFHLFRIGDAVSSRDIHAAVLEAFRLCRAI
ncbi:NAD(P)-binding protein [Sulfitobacter sp. BDSS02]|nr:NAD(P)-binding protein [Sulfitobacter sp. BDSS02]MBR9851007.1 FAD-dependent oxidoreductase [Paracoccaceae bacterium]